MKIIECPSCGALIQVEDNDPDIILEPYPHIECPAEYFGEKCKEWIPLF